MTAEIYIARHGQNEDNVNGILNGQLIDVSGAGEAHTIKLTQYNH